jgi:hypothetical protein
LAATSQTGLEAPQVELFTHWTQRLASVWQAGVAPLQVLLSSVHCTHLPLAEQAGNVGFLDEHLPDASVHLAQTPPSQIGAESGQFWLVRHAMQVLVTESQYGLAPPQSLLVEH